MFNSFYAIVLSDKKISLFNFLFQIWPESSVLGQGLSGSFKCRVIAPGHTGGSQMLSPHGGLVVVAFFIKRHWLRVIQCFSLLKVKSTTNAISVFGCLYKNIFKCTILHFFKCCVQIDYKRTQVQNTLILRH